MASPSVFWNCALIFAGFVILVDACTTTNVLIRRPYIEPRSRNITVMPFNNITLTCVVPQVQDLSLIYTWYRDGGTKSIGVHSNEFTIPRFGLADEGQYYCEVKAFGHCGKSNRVTLTLDGRFDVTVTNSSLLIAEGTTAKLAINTTDVGALRYQWRKRGVEQLPDKALGGDTAVLIIPEVDGSDKGKYYCVVTNTWNVTVESPDINLTTYGRPTITIHPKSQLVISHMSISLDCEGVGLGTIEYQWESSKINESQWITIDNNSSKRLVVKNLQQSERFRCIVSNEAGGIGSKIATLTVLKIISHPQDVLAAVNSVVSFSCTVSVSSNITFSWTHNGSSINGSSTTGDTSILTITSVENSDAGSYVCTVSGESVSVMSDIATLIYYVPPPDITDPLASQAVLALQNATFTCNATGYNVKYHWIAVSGSISSRTIGINSYQLTIVNVIPSDNGTYICVVTNEGGSTESNAVQLIVLVRPPIIDSIMLNQGLDILQTAVFICNAAGYDVSYYWMVESGSLPNKAVGINSSTLVVSDLRSSDSNLYICEASNLVGKVNSSKQLMVTGLPTVTVTPSYQSIEVTNEAMFTAKADGVGLEDFKYQWKKGDENITEETNNILILQNVNESHSDNYTCYVSNEYGDSVVSYPVFLYITRNFPVITLHPENISIILTNTSTVIQLKCEAEGASSYEWQTQSGKSLTSTTGWDTNILTLYNVSISDNDDYQCVATNASGSSFSYYATLLIEVKPPIIVTITISQSLDILQTAVLTCNATGYDVSYYWTIGSGQFPNKVTGINSSILIVPDLRSSDSNSYTCVVDNIGGSVYRAKELIVTGLPEVSIMPLELSIEVTTTGHLFATPKGVGRKNFKYQWKKGSDNIADGNNNILVLEYVNENHTGHYVCHVSSEYGDSAVSNVVLVYVTRNLPHITMHPDNTTIILTNTSTRVQLKCEAEGASSYEWQTQSGKSLTSATGWNTNILTLYNVSISDNDNYQCVATNASGSSFSYFATLYIEVQLPNITKPPLSQNVSLLQDAVFVCSATGYNISYHWIFKPTSKPSEVIGINNSTLMIPNVTSSDDGKYTCVATNIGGNVRSHAAQMTIVGLPRVDVFPPTQTMEVTYNTSFIAANVSGVGAAGFTYQWRHNGTVMAGEEGEMLLIHDIEESDGGLYQCFVTNMLGDTGISNHAELIVTVTTPHIIYHPQSQDIELSSNSYNFSLYCEAEGALSYYWRRQYADIPFNTIGAGTNMLTLLDVQPVNDGRYQCVASNASGSSYSNYATLIINVREPEFIIHPTDAYAAAPFGVMFTCTAKGFGRLSIEWHREGSLVLPSQSEETVYFLEVTNSYIKSILIIYNVTDEDADKYYCAASNGLKASNSSVANLFFSGYPSRPQVVKPTSLVELVQTNFHFSLLCKSNVRNAQIHWEKRNKMLSSNVYGVNSSNLTIFNMIPNDSGEYRCVVSNSTGIIESEYSNLTVREGKPLILSHPDHATVELFATAELSCSATSYSNMTITWRRVGYPLPFSAVINHTINSPNNVTSILTIRRMFSSFFGQYYCVARNHIGETRSTSSNLIQKTSCPRMVKLPQNITVLPGETVKLTCAAHGFSSFIYVWENSYGNLSSNTRKIIRTRLEFIAVVGQQVEISELMITDIDVSDEGLYYCTVTNNCGNDTTSVWLEVDITPTIQTHPESTTFRENDTNQVVMYCLAVGIGYIQYHWEKYELSSGTWMELSHQAYATSSNLTFSIISEEDEGSYRCVATNFDGSTASRNATLRVYGPPVIDYISNAMTSVEGNIATFTCNATNDPDSMAIYQIKIEWYKCNGDQVEQDNCTVITDDVQVTDKLQSSLQFNPVDPADNGTYKCRASNHPEFYAELSTSLTVEYAPRITITNWYNVGFWCKAKAWPEATVQWFKGNDSQPISCSQLREKFIPVSPDTPSNTVYTCVGVNKVERTSKSVSFQVCAKLDPPVNGKIFYGDDRSTVAFICNNGYTLNGTTTLECVNGMWDHSPPTCN